MLLRAMSRVVQTLILAVLATAVAAVPADAASATRCPGTFQVLHDDKVGELALPAGSYDITTGGTLVCGEAARLLGTFLADWDGKLPLRWRLVAARREFIQGPKGPQSFTVSASKPPAPPGGACPYFTVVHNDRIGTLALQAGRYRVGLLNRRITCAEAARQFYSFLYEPEGVQPPWTLQATRKNAGTFRDSVVTGTGFNVSRAYANVLGGGTYPSETESRCSGDFLVRNDDPIGRTFLVRKGHYAITVFGSVDCAAAVKALQVFLAQRDGVLPKPWKLRSQTGSFTRGTTQVNGFRIEPSLG